MNGGDLQVSTAVRGVRRESAWSRDPTLPMSRPLRLALDLTELLKLRVNLLVVFTVLTGFLLGAGGASGVSTLALAHTLVGAFLMACGANALNQVLEWRHDVSMGRTAQRPLPARRLSPTAARAFGAALNLGGALWLGVLVNPLSAALGGITSVVYLLLYTPLKRITPVSLLVGAAAGALPPLIGWAAAAGSLERSAWSLFAILYLWQVPHFLAIGWLYREDYRCAGFRMLTLVDTTGRATAFHVVSYSLALVAASLLPAIFSLAGTGYLVVALVLGVSLVSLAVLFAICRTRRSARALLFGSLLYLTALFTALVAGTFSVS